eukprot:2555286-Prymnesium_polylepis.1
MRVVFYAEPSDPAAPPKAVADSESLGAAWMRTDELRAKRHVPPPLGLRGKELLQWAEHVEAGGPIVPLALLQEETDGPAAALRLQQQQPQIHQLQPQAHQGEPQALSERAVTGATGRAAAAAAQDDEVRASGADEIGTATGGGRCGDELAALLAAVESGDTCLARRALLAGASACASINAKQWTVLHVAAARVDASMARVLLLGGADPNARTHKGRTPLHMAADRRSMGMARVLLLGGADPTARDADGQSCLDWCPAHELALAQLLRSYHGVNEVVPVA